VFLLPPRDPLAFLEVGCPAVLPRAGRMTNRFQRTSQWPAETLDAANPVEH
jgi:hypothetical protein